MSADEGLRSSQVSNREDQTSNLAELANNSRESQVRKRGHNRVQTFGQFSDMPEMLANVEARGSNFGETRLTESDYGVADTMQVDSEEETDLVWIEDEISRLHEELEEKGSAGDLIKQTLALQDREQQDKIYESLATELDGQYEYFQKTLTQCAFLLDEVKATKGKLSYSTVQNNQLESTL